MSSYPRETIEFQPVAITVNGAPVITGVQFSVVPANARPGTFTDPVTIGAKIGIMISGLAPGDYKVWAKIISAPETPIIDCSTFRIT